MKKIFIVSFTLIMVAAAVFAEPASTPIKIAVSIPPQAYIAEQVGGEIVNVMTLVGPGQSPATYEITPKQMAELSGADVYFKIGVPFEKNLAEKLRHSLPDLPVIESAPDSVYYALHETSGGAHLEDPHVWLDPTEIPRIARVMLDRLVKIRPDKKEYFEANFNTLSERSQQVTEEVTVMMAPYRGDTFYVFHPAFGAFAFRFGLRQMAIEHEGKDPGGKYLAELITQMKKNKVKYIYVQPQFSERSARAIAEETGAELVELDPLAFNVIANINKIGSTLAEGFKGKK